QFHLDEPWDSDHNIKLLDKMPDVFRHPQVDTEAGTTVYLAPLDAKTMFQPDSTVGFRDVLDGTANTIMLVEGNADLAVEWTKPADWEVDFAEPFDDLYIGPNGTFSVLTGDGTVHTLTPEIGVDTLKAMLTIAGLERVDL
ncbi:MAG: DUF1559 domain-containing protein, partial [Pirellulales bacterium]|nr:DUF1559 domain-containing protein [Pirellulales bacterium]